MRTRRLFALGAIMAVFSLLMSACGGATPVPAPVATDVPATAPAAAAPTTPPAAAPSEAPATSAPTAAPAAKEPLYLTMNVEQQSTWVRNFNPFSPDTRMTSNTIMYEPLMIYNKATSKLVPWLATEYTWSADNTVLTFKLRQGVKWSDGKPFTAKDVVFTCDLVKKTPALITGLGTVLTDELESWKALDDYTVEFKFKVVNTSTLYVLANQSIVPEHIWKDVADPITFTNENPVATGPFTEVTKFDGQIYIVEKNPHYWQEGKPTFQGLRFPAYPGNDQANLALVNGELDWAGNFVPDADKTYVSKDPDNFHYYFVGGDSVMIYINPSLKPFDNPEVRKAVSMGIDRKMVVNVAMYDYVPPLDATGLSDQYKAWKNPKAVEVGTWTTYNVEKANQMLDEAGLKRGPGGIRVGPDGKPMKYTLLAVNGWTDWISACQIVAQNMKDLGIEINLETPEQNGWQETVFKGEYQWTIGWSTGGATPYNFYRGQMSKKTVLPVGQTSGENWNRYVNAEADKLLDEFVKTSDPARQKEIMDQIQMIFVNDAPALPLFPGPDWYEYNTTRFTGWPSQEDPYAPGPPYSAPIYNQTPLLVLTNLQPK